MKKYDSTVITEATKMLENGSRAEEVFKATGLPLKQIEQLQSVMSPTPEPPWKPTGYIPHPIDPNLGKELSRAIDAMIAAQKYQATFVMTRAQMFDLDAAAKAAETSAQIVIEAICTRLKQDTEFFGLIAQTGKDYAAMRKKALESTTEAKKSA